MNMGHVYWASSHDWYRSHSANADGSMTITVIDQEVDSENNLVTTLKDFATFNELKDWAGY